MEIELGLKITHTRDEATSSTEFRFAKDSNGPLFFSRETATMFILIAYLRGFKRENIEIKISEDGKQLTIVGKKPVQEITLRGWIMHKKDEIREFKKIFLIPDGVNLNRTKAKFNNDESTLRITMPKLVKGICGIEIQEVTEEHKEKHEDEVSVDDQAQGKECEAEISEIAAKEGKSFEEGAEARIERKEKINDVAEKAVDAMPLEKDGQVEQGGVRGRESMTPATVDNSSQTDGTPIEKAEATIIRKEEKTDHAADQALDAFQGDGRNKSEQDEFLGDKQDQVEQAFDELQSDKHDQVNQRDVSRSEPKAPPVVTDETSHKGGKSVKEDEESVMENKMDQMVEQQHEEADQQRDVGRCELEIPQAMIDETTKKDAKLSKEDAESKMLSKLDQSVDKPQHDKADKEQLSEVSTSEPKMSQVKIDENIERDIGEAQLDRVKKKLLGELEIPEATIDETQKNDGKPLGRSLGSIIERNEDQIEKHLNGENQSDKVDHSEKTEVRSSEPEVPHVMVGVASQKIENSQEDGAEFMTESKEKKRNQSADQVVDEQQYEKSSQKDSPLMEEVEAPMMRTQEKTDHVVDQAFAEIQGNEFPGEKRDQVGPSFDKFQIDEQSKMNQRDVSCREPEASLVVTDEISQELKKSLEGDAKSMMGRKKDQFVESQHDEADTEQQREVSRCELEIPQAMTDETAQKNVKSREEDADSMMPSKVDQMVDKLQHVEVDQVKPRNVSRDKPEIPQSTIDETIADDIGEALGDKVDSVPYRGVRRRELEMQEAMIDETMQDDDKPLEGAESMMKIKERIDQVDLVDHAEQSEAIYSEQSEISRNEPKESEDIVDEIIRKEPDVPEAMVDAASGNEEKSYEDGKELMEKRKEKKTGQVAEQVVDAQQHDKGDYVETCKGENFLEEFEQPMMKSKKKIDWVDEHTDGDQQSDKVDYAEHSEVRNYEPELPDAMVDAASQKEEKSLEESGEMMTGSKEKKTDEVVEQVVDDTSGTDGISQEAVMEFVKQVIDEPTVSATDTNQADKREVSRFKNEIPDVVVDETSLKDDNSQEKAEAMMKSKKKIDQVAEKAVAQDKVGGVDEVQPEMESKKLIPEEKSKEHENKVNKRSADEKLSETEPKEMQAIAEGMPKTSMRLKEATPEKKELPASFLETIISQSLETHHAEQEQVTNLEPEVERGTVDMAPENGKADKVQLGEVSKHEPRISQVKTDENIEKDIGEAEADKVKKKQLGILKIPETTIDETQKNDGKSVERGSGSMLERKEDQIEEHLNGENQSDKVDQSEQMEVSSNEHKVPQVMFGIASQKIENSEEDGAQLMTESKEKKRNQSAKQVVDEQQYEKSSQKLATDKKLQKDNLPPESADSPIKSENIRDHVAEVVLEDYSKMDMDIGQSTPENTSQIPRIEAFEESKRTIAENVEEEESKTVEDEILPMEAESDASLTTQSEEARPEGEEHPNNLASYAGSIAQESDDLKGVHFGEKKVHGQDSELTRFPAGDALEKDEELEEETSELEMESKQEIDQAKENVNVSPETDVSKSVIEKIDEAPKMEMQEETQKLADENVDEGKLKKKIDAADTIPQIIATVKNEEATHMSGDSQFKRVEAVTGGSYELDDEELISEEKLEKSEIDTGKETKGAVEEKVDEKVSNDIGEVPEVAHEVVASFKSEEATHRKEEPRARSDSYPEMTEIPEASETQFVSEEVSEWKSRTIETIAEATPRTYEQSSEEETKPVLAVDESKFKDLAEAVEVSPEIDSLKSMVEEKIRDSETEITEAIAEKTIEKKAGEREIKEPHGFTEIPEAIESTKLDGATPIEDKLPASTSYSDAKILDPDISEHDRIGKQEIIVDAALDETKGSLGETEKPKTDSKEERDHVTGHAADEWQFKKVEDVIEVSPPPMDSNQMMSEEKFEKPDIGIMEEAEKVIDEMVDEGESRKLQDMTRLAAEIPEATFRVEESPLREVTETSGVKSEKEIEQQQMTESTTQQSQREEFLYLKQDEKQVVSASRSFMEEEAQRPKSIDLANVTDKVTPPEEPNVTEIQPMKGKTLLEPEKQEHQTSVEGTMRPQPDKVIEQVEAPVLTVEPQHDVSRGDDKDHGVGDEYKTEKQESIIEALMKPDQGKEQIETSSHVAQIQEDANHQQDKDNGIRNEIEAGKLPEGTSVQKPRKPETDKENERVETPMLDDEPLRDEDYRQGSAVAPENLDSRFSIEKQSEPQPEKKREQIERPLLADESQNDRDRIPDEDHGLKHDTEGPVKPESGRGKEQVETPTLADKLPRDGDQGQRNETTQEKQELSMSFKGCMKLVPDEEREQVIMPLVADELQSNGDRIPNEDHRLENEIESDTKVNEMIFEGSMEPKSDQEKERFEAAILADELWRGRDHGKGSETAPERQEIGMSFEGHMKPATDLERQQDETSFLADEIPRDGEHGKRSETAPERQELGMNFEGHMKPASDQERMQDKTPIFADDPNNGGDQRKYEDSTQGYECELDKKESELSTEGPTIYEPDREKEQVETPIPEDQPQQHSDHAKTPEKQEVGMSFEERIESASPDKKTQQFDTPLLGDKLQNHGEEQEQGREVESEKLLPEMFSEGPMEPESDQKIEQVETTLLADQPVQSGDDRRVHGLYSEIESENMETQVIPEGPMRPETDKEEEKVETQVLADKQGKDKGCRKAKFHELGKEIEELQDELQLPEKKETGELGYPETEMQKNFRMEQTSRKMDTVVPIECKVRSFLLFAGSTFLLPLIVIVIKKSLIEFKSKKR